MKEVETDTMVRVDESLKKDDKKKNKTSENVVIDKFPALDGKFLLVKVGTADNPATDEAIKRIEEHLSKLFSQNNVNCVAFVTHHAVTMEIIENTA